MLDANYRAALKAEGWTAQRIAHVAHRAAEYVAQGMDPAIARFAATVDYDPAIDQEATRAHNAIVFHAA